MEDSQDSRGGFVYTVSSYLELVDVKIYVLQYWHSVSNLMRVNADRCVYYDQL